MSESKGQPAEESARAFLSEQNLPFPPMPAPMAAALTEIRPKIFATRPVADAPYNLETFRNRAMTPDPVESYALIGMDGHGYNSWALHYFLVEKGLSLFVQLPWGGVFENPDELRADIVAVFGWAAGFQERVREAVAKGHIPAGWRLVVMVSEFSRSGFGWVSPQDDEQTAPRWTNAYDIRDAVDAELAKVVAGEIRLV
jgi:hypothetical protein